MATPSWKDGTPIEPAAIDLSAYSCPEQLERLGPRRLTGALMWFGFAEQVLPKNGVQLSRRLFATKGVQLEEITEDFFDDFDETYTPIIQPQFLDLRNITRQSRWTFTGLICRLLPPEASPREKLPESFFPNKHGHRSTSRRIAKKKEMAKDMEQNELVTDFLNTLKPDRRGGRAGNNRSAAAANYRGANNRSSGPKRGILKNAGWKRSGSSPPPPPPPAPPSEPPPPPPPPPPGRPSSISTTQRSQQNQLYGGTQQPSTYYATTVATTPGTASAMATSTGQATAWPGQNYPPPSMQAYAPQAYNMYQPGSTLSGYAYGMNPTGAVGANAGYLSTGTYIQPASTSSAASSYVVNTSTVQQTTQGWSQSAVGTSTSNYATYPSAATSTASSNAYTAGYFSQPVTTNTSYPASGSSSFSSQPAATSQSGAYSSQTASSSDTSYNYNNYQSDQSGASTYDTTNQSAASNYNNDDNDMSTNWPDTDTLSTAETTRQTTQSSVPYTTTNWKKTRDTSASSKDDQGSANAWLASYGTWPDREEAMEKRFRSRWSNNEDSSKVKGVSMGKALTTSKFKMMQCKDCNVFLSSQEQYKEHMVSEKHILKIGGNMEQVRSAQKAQEEMDRPRFHPYWRKERQSHQQQQREEGDRGDISQVTTDFLSTKQQLSQKTIDQVEEEKARMFGMRYEVKLSSVRDPGGFAPGRFGKVRTGRRSGGVKNRERREQNRVRREKQHSGRVTRSDDEDDIYRKLPSQMEHRGLGYVERGGYPEIKDEVKLDAFVKKGQLHMDTGMRLDKFLQKSKEERMGAPKLPESGMPQFGRAPPPKEYEMPRQSLVPKGFGAKKTNRDNVFKISFDSPLDMMRAAIVIPLLVPYLNIPGMDKIKEAMLRGIMPPEFGNDAEGLDLIDASKIVASDLEKTQNEVKDVAGGDKKRRKKDDEENDSTAEPTPTLSNFLKNAGHGQSASAMNVPDWNQDGDSVRDPSRKKLLSNLSSVLDKPDVLHNPAVLSFLAQTQPAVVAKVKPAKPIMKKLPPALVEEIIFKAQCIADEMEMQMEMAMHRKREAELEAQYRKEMQLQEILHKMYGGPGLLGESPMNRIPLRRSRSLDGLDNDDYYGDNDYDGDYDEDYFDDGVDNDQYARRFGFEEEDYDDDDRRNMRGPRGRFNRMEPGPRGGARPLLKRGLDGGVDNDQYARRFGFEENDYDDDDRPNMHGPRRHLLEEPGPRGGARPLLEEPGPPRRARPFLEEPSPRGGARPLLERGLGDGVDNDQYARRFGFEENDYDDDDRPNLHGPRRHLLEEPGPRGGARQLLEEPGPPRRARPFLEEPSPRGGGRPLLERGLGGFNDGRPRPLPERRPGDFDDARDMHDPGEFYGRRLYEGPDEFDRMPPHSMHERAKIGLDQDEDDEFSNYRNRMKGSNPSQTRIRKTVQTEEELEEKRERRRQRRKAKKERQRQAAAEEASDDDDDDDEPSHLYRSALPPQLLAVIGSTKANTRKEETSTSHDPLEGDEYSVFRAKMKKQKTGETQEASRPIRSTLQAQLALGSGKKQKQMGQRKQDVEGEDEDVSSQPIRHFRSALPPQLLAAVGSTEAESRKDEGDEYSIFRAKTMKKQKPGPTQEVSRPIRSALPPQLLAAAGSTEADSRKEKAAGDHLEGDEYSVFRAKMKKEKPGQVQEASRPIRSAFPPQLLASASSTEADSRNEKAGVSPDPLAGDEYSVFRAKMKKQKAGPTQEASHPNRSALPPQLLATAGSTDADSRKESTSTPKSKDAIVKAPDLPKGDDYSIFRAKMMQKKQKPGPTEETVHHHRSSLPPQLLAMMSSQETDSGQGNAQPKKNIPSQDTEKKASKKKVSETVESMEVDDKPSQVKIDMSPEEKQAAMKSFKIPKKQQPPPPKKAKKTVKPAKEPQTKDVASHPIRSAIPAQLLMGDSGDESSSSTSSTVESRAQNMGLATEDWKQGKGGGTMTRRSSRKRTR
ncbi:uncharacterized protein [Amphiura filiformis]|uniref:uncharacterized protein n=1 Tax=Amphiura filiformis TaxID=82378 RepID=UPI003B225585